MSESQRTDEGEDDAGAVIDFSEQALDHARRLGDSLSPHAYEVWYAYAAGDQPGLRDRVNRELEKTQVVDLETIEQIYQEHFLERRLSKGMTRIGADLDSGLRGTVATLRDGVATTQRFLEALQGARDRIAGLTNREDAERSVNELLDLARVQASQTSLVSDELIQVQAQVMELQDELQRLRERAYLDHLTQIPNRLYMEEVMAREIIVARATGSPLCFAMADLDHFKRVNDTYGHTVGDAMLRHVAELLTRSLKGQDTPARFGGEEFAIILPRTLLANAALVVDKIRQEMADTDFVLSREGGTVGRISLSFGVTELRPDDTVAAVIQRADELLYRAKERGRNRVESDA